MHSRALDLTFGKFGGFHELPCFLLACAPAALFSWNEALRRVLVKLTSSLAGGVFCVCAKAIKHHYGLYVYCCYTHPVVYSNLYIN